MFSGGGLIERKDGVLSCGGKVRVVLEGDEFGYYGGRGYLGYYSTG